MDRLRAWLEQNRRIALPVLAVIVAVVVFWTFSRILGGGAPAEVPAPPTATPAAPAPAPPAPPAAEEPTPAPQTPGGSVVLAGRADPFAPLVTEPQAAPSRPGPSGGPAPLPPPPLPLPPLPPGPGAAPGTPGAPGGPQAQPAPPPPEAGITVLGIISDAKSLVIVSISGKTEILFEGEAAGDLRVIKIDAVRGVVTFERISVLK